MRISRAGFTLIELLVVVAIIAILAAILLPIFAQAIHNSKESHCQNNLKQIGNAFEMYRNDYDDFYPVAHNLHNDVYDWEPAAYHQRGVGGYDSPFWWEALLPYVKNREIFKDPLDKGSGMSFGKGFDSMYDYWKAELKKSPYFRTNDMSCSYVWNGALGWTDLWQAGQGQNYRPTGNCHYRPVVQNGVGGPSPKHQGQVVRPAVRYLAWDWIGFWHRVGSRKINGVLAYGYSAGWTVLFVDTHVKWVNFKEFDEIADLPDEEALGCWWIPPESDRAP